MAYKYSKLQWLYLFLYCFINTLCGLTCSIPIPFFPTVAERKGATAVQYGIVVGIFNFSLFIMCLLSSVIISKFGAGKVGVLGVFIIGCTNIIFGFIDKIDTLSLFIGVSIVIRIFEGFGYAMARNASIAIVSFEFSSNVEMAIAFIQTFFNARFLIGPVVGGALFELGGFILPFVVVGALLLFTDIVILLSTTDFSKNKTISFTQILEYIQRTPTILGIFILFVTYLVCGFITISFAPHIQKLNVSPFYIGSMFLCLGVGTSICSFAIGKLFEKYDIALLVGAISSIILICSFMILGPAPYLPFHLNIYSCIFGIFTLGIGIGGGQMSAFSILNKSARIANLPQDIQTSAIVSSIFTSSLSLGLLIGPIIGGYFFDEFGFQWGSHFFVVFNLITLFAIIVCHYIWRGDPKNHKSTESIFSERFSRYKSFENN